VTDNIPTREPIKEVAAVTEIKARPKQATKQKPSVLTSAILAEVLADIEVGVALNTEKFGEQNQPLSGGDNPEGGRAYALAQSLRWRAINDQRHIDGVLGWDGILLEEMFETLAKSDPDAVIAELVCVAAVAVQAILSLRRQQA